MPPRTRWFLIVVLVAAGIVAAAQVGKPAIAAPLLQRDLGLSLAAVSLIVGAYAALGAIGGLAAGWAVSRIGLRASLTAGMATIGCASLAGALATDGTTLLLLRIVEGCGLLAVAVSLPTLLGTIAAPRHRDVVMAIWGAYMPAGTALMMLAGPWLALFGWQGLWVGYGVVALLFVPALALTPLPPPDSVTREARIGPLLRQPGPALLSVTFALYTFQFTAISGLLPALLVDHRGTSIAAAGTIAALAVIANMIGNLSAGALMRWGIPLWSIIIAAFAMIGLATFGIFAPHLPVAYVAVLAAVGLGVTGAIPASIFAASPRLFHDTAMLALMFGLINQTSNVGQLLGPVVLGNFVQLFGWSRAPILFVVIALCGIGIGVVLRFVLRTARPAASRRS